MEQIEGSLLSLWNSDDILNSLKKENTRSLEAMIESENRPANNTHMSMLQFEEVLFYLKSFGTQKQMLEFLVKYRLVKRACNYVQSQVSLLLCTMCIIVFKKNHSGVLVHLR